MFLVVKRTSVSWTMHGQTSRSMLLQLLPGAESENRRWSTIGFDEWLLNIIVLRNSHLAGLSTDRAPVGRSSKALRVPFRCSYCGVWVKVAPLDWPAHDRVLTCYCHNIIFRKDISLPRNYREWRELLAHSKTQRFRHRSKLPVTGEN